MKKPSSECLSFRLTASPHHLTIPNTQSREIFIPFARVRERVQEQCVPVGKDVSLNRVPHSKTAKADSASKVRRLNSKSGFHAQRKQGIQQLFGERYSEGQGILRQDPGARTFQWSGRHPTIVVPLSGGTKALMYPKPNHQPATFTVLNFPVFLSPKPSAELNPYRDRQYSYPGFARVQTPN
jgi:hypothetical protein